MMRTKPEPKSFLSLGLRNSVSYPDSQDLESLYMFFDMSEHEHPWRISRHQ